MPKPKKPRALKPGEIVGIIAPGSPVREEFLASGEAFIDKMGLVPRRAPSVLARDRYTAGSAQTRANDIVEMLADPEVRALWCARGGYGSPHLPPLIAPDHVTRDPKVLIGASDITALLLWFLKLGVPCLHGPMPAQELARDNADPDELLRHLTVAQPFGRVNPPELRSLHPGRGTGPTTGGCLSLVVASLGTPWEIETDGRLLFLEDVDTKPYQIDRMLTQLRQAGKLGTVSGILFGQMRGCRQTADQGYELDDVLTELTADLGVPVVSGFPFGHTTGLHRPLPLGVTATLTSPDSSLELHEGMVADPVIV